MSESDSEADEPARASSHDPNGVRYRIEGKFISAKDKANIMAMPEAKREQILSERMEEVEKENFTRQLLQRREAEKKAAEATEKKKRKAASSELDESPRATNKQKIAAKDTLANYKRKREQMNEARRGGADRQIRDKQSPPPLFDHSSSVESEAELEDRRGKPAAAPQKEPEPTLRDFEHARIGRTGFGWVCFTPGFEEKMMGCFARANTGLADPATGINIYRMVQIKKVVSGKPYRLEDRNGQPFTTDQYIHTSSGKNEKTFHLVACSDSPFTEEELERFKQDQIKDGMILPTRSALKASNDGFHELIHHRWTDEEINAKMERSGKRKEHDSRLQRAQLVSERKHAFAMGDSERVTKIDDELEELGVPRPSLVNNIVSKQIGSGKSQSQADRIARMKEANRKAEMENRRKIQLAEKRRERVAAQKGIVDPFARVKTTAIIHHDAYNGPRSKSGTPEPSSRPNGLMSSPNKGPSSSTLKVPGVDKSIDDLFGEGSDRSRAQSVLPKSGEVSSEAATPSSQGKGPIIFRKKQKVEELPDLDLDIDI